MQSSLAMTKMKFYMHNSNWIPRISNLSTTNLFARKLLRIHYILHASQRKPLTGNANQDFQIIYKTQGSLLHYSYFEIRVENQSRYVSMSFLNSAWKKVISHYSPRLYLEGSYFFCHLVKYSKENFTIYSDPSGTFVCMTLNQSHRTSVKGQLISKCLFGISNSPKKTNLKTKIFALAYWGRNFSFIFGWLEENKMSLRN